MSGIGRDSLTRANSVCEYLRLAMLSYSRSNVPSVGSPRAKMLGKVVILMLASFGRPTFADDEEQEPTCARNRTLLETSGDAVLSVFVDRHHGPFCNLSTGSRLEELSTALYVVHTLNKYGYVPGRVLGMKVYDSCRNETSVYKQALQTAVDLECEFDYYELGILVHAKYGKVLDPLRNYSVLPISTYDEQNLTKPLINAMVHYLSTRFETIDLVLANYDFALDHFLLATKDAGICVKDFDDDTDIGENNGDAVIVVIGHEDDIRKWMAKREVSEGPRTTWVLLPLDGSRVDDLLPVGSYVINPVPFDLDPLQSHKSTDEFLEANANFVIHSPHLLGIGKAIVELAQVLQDIQKRSCPHEADDCVMPRFTPHLRQEIRNSDVYEALRILPKAHSVKYLVSTRGQQGLVEVASYRVEAAKFRVLPDKKVSKMPRLCLKKFAANCEKCVNFQKRLATRRVAGGALWGGPLKTGIWIPIFLTIDACGTFACSVIIIFIVYRYIVDEVLDGNPTLTILLIFANVFTLQTVLPFCMEDEYFGADSLNSRKIFVTTLAFGMIFSVMLSRALFLAFSRGGVFTTHINGYLQCLLVFFMAGVQIAISTMYFVLSRVDSTTVMRGLTFLALLSYDIFLLLTLFVVCCFVAQIQRNYREGKCFFGTVIGILIAWAVWVTCFILMEPDARDYVVCSGIIATAYLIIIGILIPRTYYMARHLAKEKDQRFEVNIGSDPRLNTLGRQARTYYDYVPPVSINNLRAPYYPNYYGNSSPNQRYLTRSRSPDPRRNPGYSNYGFHGEMREVESSYMVPRVCIENTDMRSPVDRSGIDPAYARPRCDRRQRIVLEEKDCIETDVYVEGRLSPSRRAADEIYPTRCSSPRMGQTEATIREEEEDVQRITRF